MAEPCKFGGLIKPNGNCTVLDDDGFVDQSVGDWSPLKHEHLRLYIEATREVRAKFLPPRGSGGAAFVDLFAGPGRARVRDQRATIAGSPLIALEHSAAPFSKIVLCELDAENVAALRGRTAHANERVEIVEGDCNMQIARIVRSLPAYGLNVAFYDPFGAKSFRWSTIAQLGTLERMDLLLHFPTGTVKRNFLHPGFDQTIDGMIGHGGWRTEVRSADEVPKLIDNLRDQLASIGYDGKRVNTLAVSNSKNAILYHLVFASKHPRGSKIWQSIRRNDGDQRGFGF